MPSNLHSLSTLFLSTKASLELIQTTKKRNLQDVTMLNLYKPLLTITLILLITILNDRLSPPSSLNKDDNQGFTRRVLSIPHSLASLFERTTGIDADVFFPFSDHQEDIPSIIEQSMLMNSNSTECYLGPEITHAITKGIPRDLMASKNTNHVLHDEIVLGFATVGTLFTYVQHTRPLFVACSRESKKKRAIVRVSFFFTSLNTKHKTNNRTQDKDVLIYLVVNKLSLLLSNSHSSKESTARVLRPNIWSVVT